MRRRETGLEVLFDILTMVPSWVGPVLAVLAFPVFRYLIPYALYHGQQDVVAKTLWQVLANFSEAFAPVVSLLLLLLWAGAELKKWIDRRRLDGTRDLEDVRQLSWREFEALVAEAYRRKGYTVEETGSSSGDGGVDLILHRNAKRTFVQCKHWKNEQVRVGVVRELSGVMQDGGADSGIVVSYGDFTEEAERFADRNSISLVNGRALEQMIAEVRSSGTPSADTPPSSERRSTSPVATAPLCPICRAVMIRRTARKGANAGTEFWGCPKYPSCLGKRSL